MEWEHKATSGLKKYGLVHILEVTTVYSYILGLYWGLDSYNVLRNFWKTFLALVVKLALKCCHGQLPRIHLFVEYIF